MLFGTYKIKAAQMINERVKITGRGKPLILNISVNIDTVAIVARKAIKELETANNMLQNECNEGTFESFKDCVIKLFNVLFGEKNTKLLVNYFNGEFIEMLAAVYPFITERIIPQFGAALSVSKRK